MSKADKAWIQRMIADSEEVQHQDKLILAAAGPVRCESVPVSSASPRTGQERTKPPPRRYPRERRGYATPGAYTPVNFSI